MIAVQTILGHEKVDTTLGYARLYDGTVASDYYRAMGQVERLFVLPENVLVSTTTPAEMIAMIDSLANGTLNDPQRQTLQALRDGILSMASLTVRELV